MKSPQIRERRGPSVYLFARYIDSDAVDCRVREVRRTLRRVMAGWRFGSECQTSESKCCACGRPPCRRLRNRTQGQPQGARLSCLPRVQQAICMRSTTELGNSECRHLPVPRENMVEGMTTSRDDHGTCGAPRSLHERDGEQRMLHVLSAVLGGRATARRPQRDVCRSQSSRPKCAKGMKQT